MPGLEAWGRREADTRVRLGRGKTTEKDSGNLDEMFLEQPLMGLSPAVEDIPSVPTTTKKTSPSSPSSRRDIGQRRVEKRAPTCDRGWEIKERVPGRQHAIFFSSVGGLPFEAGRVSVFSWH